MKSTIACPSCKARLGVDLALAAGRKLLCPSCKAKFTVEEATAKAIQAETPRTPGGPAGAPSAPAPATPSPAKPPPLPEMEIPTISGELDEGSQPAALPSSTSPAKQGGGEDDDEDYRPRRRRRRDEADDEDDRPRSRRRNRDDEDEDERSVRRRRDVDEGGLSTIIPYKNGYALAAYYFSVFGLIMCLCGLSVIPGVVAVILGFQGLRYAKANPHAKGQVHAWVGIILGMVEILYTVVVVVGVSVAIMAKK